MRHSDLQCGAFILCSIVKNGCSQYDITVTSLGRKFENLVIFLFNCSMKRRILLVGVWEGFGFTRNIRLLHCVMEPLEIHNISVRLVAL